MGINPLFVSGEEEKTIEAERKNALIPFQEDLYGRKEVLMKKKMQRCWKEENIRTVEGWISDGKNVKGDDVVMRLLRWEGDGLFDEIEKLPWN